MCVIWKFLLTLALVCAVIGVSRAQQGPSPSDQPSPQPNTRQASGLPSRAIPVMPLITPTAKRGRNLRPPFFGSPDPFYDNLFAVQAPDAPFRLDPSEYREVTAYQPPQGLLPLWPSPGLWNALEALCQNPPETYDSNIQQTPTNPIGDFFTTLSFGADLQVGTPDSIYLNGYDTILALNAHYEFAADLFSQYDKFDAIDNQIKMDGRIGRDAFILRPFLTAEDFTGSDFLTVENVGRVERQRLVTGLRGDFKLTSQLTWSQIYSHLYFEHPEEGFINFEVYRNYQEITYRALPDTDVFAWGEYRYTDPDLGREWGGIDGWRRLEGQTRSPAFQRITNRLGLDQPRLVSVPGWSGVFIQGHTSFRVESRACGSNSNMIETIPSMSVTPNDNYINNTLQFAPEIFLGGNWYVTPYFGVSYNRGL